MARLEKVVSDTNVVSRSSHGHPVELLAVLELAGAAVGPEMHVLESATLRSEPRLVLRDEDVHGVLDEGVGVLEIRRDEHVRPAWFNTKLSTEGDNRAGQGMFTVPRPRGLSSTVNRQ